MPVPQIANLEKLLAAGKEGALLRFGLGSAYAQAGETTAAIAHLRRAVEIDPHYSAAWKLLGKTLAAASDRQGALAAFESGVVAAQQKGDKQALREMQVFIRRLANPEPPA